MPDRLRTLILSTLAVMLVVAYLCLLELAND